MGQISREAARAKVRMWDAHSAASGMRDDVDQWLEDQRAIGGL